MGYKHKTEEYIKITLLAASYILHKRILEEAKYHIIERDPQELNAATIICTHIENVVKNLDDRNRIIIENEVLRGKTGRWYEEFFSVPSYYRYRNDAYKVFLNALEK